ncbi:MAG: Dabb family protein [Candidatus Pacebacteria bacterium]|nr:Dabb family protein [Candidatus Paceibacterota bacterium]MCF7862793.1 Dabb family protein [Candidatus Paceibacterota bacterium]
MVKHILLFKFKQGVSEEEKNKGIEMLRSLKEKVPEIKEWEIGIQREKSEKFYDFAQVSSFENIEDIKRFGENPEHEKVKAYLKERADWVKVDYDF